MPGFLMPCKFSIFARRVIYTHAVTPHSQLLSREDFRSRSSPQHAAGQNQGLHTPNSTSWASSPPLGIENLSPAAAFPPGWAGLSRGVSERAGESFRSEQPVSVPFGFPSSFTAGSSVQERGLAGGSLLVAVLGGALLSVQQHQP